MTTQHKVWVIEEILNDGQVAHRQSMAVYEENEDGSWQWIKPEDRLLSNAAKARWDEVMAVLADVNGQDLRAIVCGVGLMDHCNESVDIDNYVEE